MEVPKEPAPWYPKPAARNKSYLDCMALQKHPSRASALRHCFNHQRQHLVVSETTSGLQRKRSIVPLPALQKELPLGVSGAPSPLSSSLHAGRQSDIFTKRFEKGSVQTDGITRTRHIESACRQRPLSQQQFQAGELKTLTGTFRIESTLYRKCPPTYLHPLTLNL